MTTMDLEEKILMPREVREILGADNDEIIKLCQKISLIPKKIQQVKPIFHTKMLKD